MLQQIGKMGSVVVAALLLGCVAFAAEAVSPNAEILSNAVAGTAVPAGQEKFYNSATGELYADIMGTTVTGQRTFRNTLPSIADYSQSAHMVSNSYCGPDNNWVMWDTPFLVRDMRERDDGYLGHKQTISGFATGVSRMLGESSAIGLAVGYDARKLTGRDDYHWRNKADTFHAALYGGTAVGCFFVDGYAGYSRAWQRTERTVYGAGAMGITRDLLNHANYNDTVLSAGVKASYVWILASDVRLTTSVGLDYSHVRTGAFTETGEAGNPSLLHVRKGTHNSIQTPVAAAINRTFNSDFLTFGGVCSMWTPEVRAAYIPQFGSERANTRYGLADGRQFVAKSAKLGGSYGTVGAGLKIKLRDKFIFAVDYDYAFGKKYDNHTVTGTYGVSF